MSILVTGCAGFIGYHLCERLLTTGHPVVGIDSLNDYYSVGLKRDRLKRLIDRESFEFFEGLVEDDAFVDRVFEERTFRTVVHLAAQAGVTYSLEVPREYIQANVVGFINVLESCRVRSVRHFVYASSSSVYGLNESLPSEASQVTAHPMSLYAATKKSNELMAHAYSHLFNLPTTGLRFFTVYGPWGRPDMAAFLFTAAILNDHPIDLYNNGRSKRSFTYVDDVVEGIVRVSERIPEPDPSWSANDPDPSRSSAPFRVYNIGSDETVDLEQFVNVIEKAVGKEARRNLLPARPGDVEATAADIADLERDVGYRPSTSIEDGIQRFVDWYRDYYGK